MSPATQIDKFISNHAVMLLKEKKRYENRLLKKKQKKKKTKKNAKTHDATAVNLTVRPVSLQNVSSSFTLNLN